MILLILLKNLIQNFYNERERAILQGLRDGLTRGRTAGSVPDRHTSCTGSARLTIISPRSMGTMPALR